MQKSFITDVRLGSKYVFYMQCKPIDWFLFDTNFYRKVSSKQTIKIWIKLKKIYTKYDKICIFEKISTQKLSSWKKFGVERSGISLLFSKSMPWLLRVYIDPFFNLYITLPWYHQDGKLMKQLVFKLSQVVHKYVFHVFYGILAPHLQMGKMKESDRAHEACCNGCHLYTVEVSYLASVATRRWWQRCCASR